MLGLGQRAQIWVGGPAAASPELLFETDGTLIEAPNWSLDGACLFVNGDGALTGGAVKQVTPDDGSWHFLHGVSPDGTRLAYVQLGDFTEPGRLAVLSPDARPVVVDTGPGHIDGPEWSPDGRWIYVNSWSPDSGRFAFIAYPVS